MYNKIPKVSLDRYNLVSKSTLFSWIGSWIYGRLQRMPGRLRLLLLMALQNLSIKYKAYHEETINLNNEGVVFSWPAITMFLPGGFISKQVMENHWNLLNALGLNQNAVIFDIGANIGSYSIVYGLWTANSRGKVYSFEPFQENFRFLKKNITNCGLSHVSYYNFGFSDISGSFFLGMPSKEQHKRFRWSKYLIESGTFSMHAKKPSHDNTADLTNVYRGGYCKFDTVDHFTNTNNIKHIDFIKIDTEGHELSVLKGCKETLQKFRPKIQLEMNSFSLDMAKTDPKEITQWLKDINYILYFLEENNLQPFNEEILFNGKFAQGNHIAFLFELFAIPR